MKYTKKRFPPRGSPFKHTSLASKNKLTIIGGKYGARAKLDRQNWTDASPRWEDNTKVVLNFFSACSVKIAQERFVIFGGGENIGGEIQVRRTILEIDTANQTVKSIGTMLKPRMAFGCEYLDKDVYLLSGGYSDHSNPLQTLEIDEIFHSAIPQRSMLLKNEHSLKRFNHKLMRMDKTIFAFGGSTSKIANVQEIDEYNENEMIWEKQGKKLHSKNTEELVIAPYPISALDCVPHCHCGISSNRTDRIYGGENAQV